MGRSATEPGRIWKLVALKIVIRMRKVVHLYQFLIFGITDFRSLHLHHFLDFDFLKFLNHLFGRREIPRIPEIPDICRWLFKGFAKAKAGLEADLERFDREFKGNFIESGRPAAGWLVNLLNFIENHWNSVEFR